jgi:aminoglycoside phosphotransferase (APT) family kinase protein
MYHDRFTEDLAFVAGDPPPFVSGDRLAWMQQEAAALETRVRELPAFAEPAVSAIHNDLWVNNVLIDGEGQWHLLDWDGLALGDPLIDWVMLFGPTRDIPRAATEDVIRAHTPLSAAERERLAIYLRASQLDWVLDPLADWVQAAHEPEHGAQVRAANEQVHRLALEVYLTRFGP